MSLELINEFVHELIEEEDSLTDSNDCRNSADKIAKKIKNVFPEANVSFLAYPEARQGIGVHYSVLVKERGRKMIVNPVAAPGFPQYIGDAETAVPTFSMMQESDTVR